jgi:hypothetical protein
MFFIAGRVVLALDSLAGARRRRRIRGISLQPRNDALGDCVGFVLERVVYRADLQLGLERCAELLRSGA